MMQNSTSSEQHSNRRCNYINQSEDGLYQEEPSTDEHYKKNNAHLARTKISTYICNESRINDKERSHYNNDGINEQLDAHYSPTAQHEDEYKAYKSLKKKNPTTLECIKTMEECLYNHT